MRTDIATTRPNRPRGAELVKMGFFIYNNALLFSLYMIYKIKNLTIGQLDNFSTDI